MLPSEDQPTALNKTKDWTRFLLVIRLILVFLPQFGYIHPDEFFQSTEITAGDVLKTDSYRPWEFTTENPIRCSVFVHLFAYLPYKILSYTGSVGYLRLIAPRLVVCCMSFVVDYVVREISGPGAGRIVATSYIALAYFTRTFSNVTETVLFALLVFISFPLKRREHKANCKVNDAAVPGPSTKKLDEKDSEVNETPKEQPAAAKPAEASSKTEGVTAESKPPLVSSKTEFNKWSTEVTYVTVLVCGFFNRPTFLCYALVPFYSRFFAPNRFKDFLTACIRMSLYAVPSCCFFIAIDSIYYRGQDAFVADPLKNMVITPLNFLLYNSDSANLAKHGLHHRWLHLVINIPLLFGLHAACIYQDIYRVIFRRGCDVYERFDIHLCTMVPLALLSLFPHQEPRFLLPLLIPFALRNAHRISYRDRSRVMWYTFNLYMFFFFAFMHQAGVVSMQLFSYDSGKYLYFHTYMPPRHLMNGEVHREIIDLKEADLNVLEDALQKHHEGYLVFPAGVHPTVDRALENSYCQILEKSFHFPHVATEYLPQVIQRCGFGLSCLFFESLTLHKVRFRCDLAL